MSGRETHDNAFLRDPDSQALCLEDALRTGSGRAMLHALRAVAGACGLERLTADAGLPEDTLATMLDAGTRCAPTQLAETILKILDRRAAAQSAKMVKNRRDSGKTGGSDKP